jgi:hypothetical protein
MRWTRVALQLRGVQEYLEIYTAVVALYCTVCLNILNMAVSPAGRPGDLHSPLIGGQVKSG